MNTFQSRVAPLYRVRIDGGDIIGVVSGITFYANDYCSVSVSWLSNGTHQEAWFNEERLEIVEIKE
jgi:hypothetical protein